MNAGLFGSVTLTILTAGVVSASTQRDDEMGVFNNVYINDTYEFALPMSLETKACIGASYSGEHGFPILLSNSSCRKISSSPHLFVSASWSNTGDERSIGARQANCGGGGIVPTSVRFNRKTMFRCVDQGKRPATYFVIRNLKYEGSERAIAYSVFLYNMKDEQRVVEHDLDKIFSQVRYLEN